MESLKQKSYKALAWDFIGRLSGQTVGFVISVILARLLSPEDFGILAMVNVFIAISNSFLDMGMGLALIQKKDVNEKHYSSVFFFNISVGLFLTICLFFTSGFLASFYKKDIIKDVTQVMSLLFIINAFGNVSKIKLRKNLDFKILFNSNMLSAVTSGIVGVAMAFNGFGIWSLVLQSLLTPLIANLYLFFNLRWSPKLKLYINELKELWPFGFRMFIAGFIDVAYGQLDSLIIGKLFSPLKLGFYYRAKSFNNYIVSYTAGSLLNILLPVISNLQDQQERLKNLVFKSMHLICLVTFYLTGLFYLSGSDIIHILFGSKWEPAVPYFRLFLLSGYVFPVSALLVNLIVGMGNSKANLKLEILKKILFSLSFIAGFQFGIEGFLVSNAIVGAFAVYLNLIFASKQIECKTRWLGNILLLYLFNCFTIVFSLFFVLRSFESRFFLHFILSLILYSLSYYFILKIFKIKGLEIFKDELSRFQIGSRFKNFIKKK